MRATVLAAIAAILALGLVVFGFQYLTNSADEWQGIVFQCEDDTSFQADFRDDPDRVVLRLDGESEVILLRARSASGIRYADAAGDNVFREHQGVAILRLDRLADYDDCVRQEAN